MRDQNVIAITTFLVGITALVGSLINTAQSKKQTYIDTITKSRIDWIKSFKDNVSEYVNLTQLSGTIANIRTGDDQDDFFHALALVRNKIYLQLNYNGYLDSLIIDCIKKTFHNIESVYEITTILNLKEDKEKVGYFYHLLSRGDTEILKQFDIEFPKFDDLIKMKGNKQIEVCKRLHYKLFYNHNSDLLESINIHINQGEKYSNDLIMYSHIYSKLEWERAKRESHGTIKKFFNKFIKKNQKKSERKMIDKMISEYKLNLFDFSLGKVGYSIE